MGFPQLRQRATVHPQIRLAEVEFAEPVAVVEIGDDGLFPAGPADHVGAVAFGVLVQAGAEHPLDAANLGSQCLPEDLWKMWVGENW
jgi:hypothetical protein